MNGFCANRFSVNTFVVTLGKWFWNCGNVVCSLLQSICSRVSKKGNFPYFMKIPRLWALFLYRINWIKFWNNLFRRRKDNATGFRRHQNIWTIEESAMHLFCICKRRFWVSCIHFFIFRQTIFWKFVICIQSILEYFWNFYSSVVSLGK